MSPIKIAARGSIPTGEMLSNQRRSIRAFIRLFSRLRSPFPKKDSAMDTTLDGTTQAAPDYSPNGTAHTWRPPQVRELGPRRGGKGTRSSPTEALIDKVKWAPRARLSPRQRSGQRDRHQIGGRCTGCRQRLEV